MDPIIIDPLTYDKRAAALLAHEHAMAFLDVNGIPGPKEWLWEASSERHPPGRNPWHDKGWYWDRTVFVNLKRSRVPTRVPGFAWSFTGFKADLTAPGVVAHETGHHVHFELEKRLGRSSAKKLYNDIEIVAIDEAPVSGYEPNPHEVMAEACRLFILNPNLLREGRPKRYALLLSLNLRPLHRVPWRDVLVHAHPKIISAAENWIKRIK